MSKTVSILGSTGVIGSKTLEVISDLGDGFQVAALTAGKNVHLLAQQIRRFRPTFVSVESEQARSELAHLIADFPDRPDIGVGEAGLDDAAAVPSDIVVTAIVGARGLKPTWTAIERGATIGLANKETLVAAGGLVMPLAAARSVPIIPIDSEHSALFQCLLAGASTEVSRYLLTASGGPFRTWSQSELEGATVADALKHPNWSMGRKITVDSASMMNKGLEVIEAHHLFGAAYDKIEVIVHPQSILHSMVEFKDGFVVGQMATAEMKLPIQYALTYPARRPNRSDERLDFVKLGQLSFEAPDMTRFPSLRLAYEAGRAGGYAPCVLNAANEIAVNGFLEGRISFLGMAKLVESALLRHESGNANSVGDIIEMDQWARLYTESMLNKGGWGD